MKIILTEKTNIEMLQTFPKLSTFLPSAFSWCILSSSLVMMGSHRSVGWNEKPPGCERSWPRTGLQHRNSTLQLVDIDKNWWKHVNTTGFSTKNPWCQSWRVWVFLVMLTTFFVELKTATWDIRISMLEIPRPSHGHIPLLPCPRRVCWLPRLPQMWRKQHLITFSRVNDDVKSSDVIQKAGFWI